MVIEAEQQNRTHTSDQSTPGSSPGDWGWYLYGITRASEDASMAVAESITDVPDSSVLVDERGPVRLLACGDLAAVVRRVALIEFSEEALETRLRDLDALEELAREHNAVIADVHQHQTILPATFGHVYPNSAALRTAMLTAGDALKAQLERLEGCDEWAIHLYADPSAMQSRLAAERSATGDPQGDLESTQPGRAYLLKRKLAVELGALTEQALGDLARDVYERLAELSVATEVSPVGRSQSDSGAPPEILRATFLVRRSGLDAFLATIDDIEQKQDGVRCTPSGPWPPYSFAALPQEGQ